MLDDETGEPFEEADSAFADVEQFLAGFQEDPGDAEAYEEDEVREILAVTWQERRKTSNGLQKARKFQEAGQVCRQFCVEVKELKEEDPVSQMLADRALGP